MALVELVSKFAGTILAFELDSLESVDIFVMKKIPAKDCSVKPVQLAEAQSFLKENGRSKPVEGVNLSLGLYRSGALISVAQFGYPRTAEMAQRYSIELYCLVFQAGIVVPGGVSKLLQHYIREYKPADFFFHLDSFSEEMEVYEQAGMTLVSQSKSGKSGKRVYEWVDPNRTYYTYKITATDSDKYYYGVRHVKKANASFDDCLHDGYWGSGSSKYQFWKSKHSASLQKSVLEVFPRRASAFVAEKELVGDSYKSDPLSLNSASGGKMTTPHRTTSNVSEKECPVHGKSKHQGDHCRKCSSVSMVTTEFCETHGEVKHRWGKCTKCTSVALFHMENCITHGTTKFRKDRCIKCIAEKSVTKKSCKLHGKTTFRGGSCAKCLSQASYELKFCEIHGEVNHHGDQCSTCQVEELFTIQDCSIHGKTTFRGKYCAKCMSKMMSIKRVCRIHGESLHRGEWCLRCLNSKSIELRECSVHGLSKFQGNSCRKCVTATVRT